MRKPLEEMTQDEVLKFASDTISKANALMKDVLTSEAFEISAKLNQIRQSEKCRSIVSIFPRFEEESVEFIKKQIATFYQIDSAYIQTWEEAHKHYVSHEREKWADFLVNYRDVYDDRRDKNKLDIKKSVLPLLGYSIAFHDCRFSGDISMRNMKEEIENHFGFYRCEFQKFDVFKGVFSGGLRFSECDFKGLAHFRSTTIKQLRVSGIFHREADFSDCRVLENSFFVNSVFKSSARFDGSIFEKNIDFYGTTFEQSPNFRGIVFKDEVNLVNTKLNFGYRELKNQTRDSTKIANDYRDSFRLIKNNLLKNNNALDASQYHKMELYCKEIEFLARIKEAICPQKIKENGREKTLSSAEQSLLPLAMDFLQLWFYRKTSDHHTNLLRIIAWVVACIGLFGYVLLGIFASDKEIAIPWFGVSEALSSVDSWIVSVGCLGIVVVCLIVRWVEWLVGSIGSLLGVWILTSCPSYLIDLFKGSLLDGRFDRWQNATLLVHVILLGLLLFSLQKTARKNTIISS